MKMCVAFGWSAVECHEAYAWDAPREHYHMTLRGPLVTTGEVTHDGSPRRHGVTITWIHDGFRWHRGEVISQCSATDAWLRRHVRANHRQRCDVGFRDIRALMAAYPVNQPTR